MGIAILKQMNAKTPAFIKIIFAPVIRRKLINNPVFISQYKELKKMDNQCMHEIKIIQYKKVKENLIHAYEHTKYYKRVFDEADISVYNFKNIDELDKIPVLTKKMIKENFDDLQADDINDYYSATTGGSTGKPLKVLLDRDSIYKEKAFIYHFWEKFGYDYKRSKLATFRGVEYGKKFYKINPLYNEIQLDPCRINAETVKKYYDKILSYGADFIHGYPSAIDAFCKFAIQEKLKIKGKFKAVFFISENVYNWQKSNIENALGCPAAAFYGHSERAVFAEQVQQTGLYTFNNYYCHTELDSNGCIITTGLINKKMPLIRYQLDDIAQKESDHYRIQGHWNGMVKGKKGECISVALLNTHNEFINKIAKLQFVQKKEGYLQISIVPIDTISEKTLMLIQNYYQSKVGNALQVEVKIVNDLIYTSRGKYQLLVRESD